jgi:hypothetical protein
VPLTDRDRRTLKIGGIIAGVLLLGFLLFNVFGGGGDELETAAPPVVPGTIGGGASETLTPTPTITLSPVAVFTGRDPFSVPFGLGASPSDGTGGTTIPPTSPGDGGTTPPPTSPGDGGTPPPTSPTDGGSLPPTERQPGNGSSETVGGHTLVLLDVFTSNGVGAAQVEVDGAVHSMSVGERFAGGEFELRSTVGNCATFLHGDESFVLCVTPQK